MFVVFKNKETFDTVQLDGVKNIAYAAGVYTVTKADDSTVTYASATWHMWSFN